MAEGAPPATRRADASDLLIALGSVLMAAAAAALAGPWWAVGLLGALLIVAGVLRAS